MVGADLQKLARVRSLLGSKSPDDGNRYAASEKLPYQILRIIVTMSCLGHCIINGIRKITKRVQYGTVHVKNCCAVNHISLFLPQGGGYCVSLAR